MTYFTNGTLLRAKTIVPKSAEFDNNWYDLTSPSPSRRTLRILTPLTEECLQQSCLRQLLYRHRCKRWGSPGYPPASVAAPLCSHWAWGQWCGFWQARSSWRGCPHTPGTCTWRSRGLKGRSLQADAECRSKKDRRSGPTAGQKPPLRWSWGRSCSLRDRRSFRSCCLDWGWAVSRLCCWQQGEGTA